MSTSKLLRVLVVCLLALVLAYGCGSGSDSASPTPTPTPTRSGPAYGKVVTTLPLFAHWLNIVGSERIDVFSLVPPGRNPHGLTAADIDLSVLGDEGLVLYNGAELEAGFEDALFENKRRGSQVVPYAIDVASPTDPGTNALSAGDDPHLWLDPVLAHTYLDTTWDSLTIIDGDGRNTYRSNARAYQEELMALNEEIAQVLAAVPEGKRLLVTQHDSFEHFARRYGFEIAGVVTETAADDLVQAVEGQGIPAVFAEYGFDDTAIKAIANDAGAELCLLYSDVLSAEVPGYMEMMRHNADEIARCLGGD